MTAVLSALLGDGSDGIANNPWPLILICYGVTLAALGGYAVYLVRRGRRASAAVPATRRRWLQP